MLSCAVGVVQIAAAAPSAELCLSVMPAPVTAPLPGRERPDNLFESARHKGARPTARKRSRGGHIMRRIRRCFITATLLGASAAILAASALAAEYKMTVNRDRL